MKIRARFNLVDKKGKIVRRNVYTMRDNCFADINGSVINTWENGLSGYLSLQGLHRPQCCEHQGKEHFNITEDKEHNLHFYYECKKGDTNCRFFEFCDWLGEERPIQKIPSCHSVLLESERRKAPPCDYIRLDDGIPFGVPHCTNPNEKNMKHCHWYHLWRGACGVVFDSCRKPIDENDDLKRD